MRKLLIVLILSPFLSFCQSKWRTSTPVKNNTTTPSTNTNTNTQTQSTWRNNPPTTTKSNSSTTYQPNNLNNQPNFYGQNPYYYSNMYNNYDPYWGYGRWGRWGAPNYGYSNYIDYNYYSPQGYRQPARVYVYEDGQTDTIKGKKPIVNVGFLYSTNKQLGGYFAVGNKIYFIMDFHSTYEPDRSTFFKDGQIDDIDFPLIEDLIKERTFYFGIGRRVERIGIHCMIGFGSEDIFWRGEDVVGEITFPKSNGKFTTLKVGTMYDIKNFTLKFDMDPIREFVQFGVGVNF